MLRPKNIGVSSKILLVMLLGGWLLNGCGGEQLPSATLANSVTVTPTQSSTQNSLASTPTIAQISTAVISSNLKAATSSAGLSAPTPGPASLKLIYATPVLSEPVDQVGSIAFSPDGQIIATGTDSGVIILREAQTGKEISRFQHNLAAIRSLAFSPDGKNLVSGSSPYPQGPKPEPGLIILWEVSSGRLLKTIGYYSNGVNSVVYRYDGKVLATMGTQRSLTNNGLMDLWKITGVDIYESISWKWSPNRVGDVNPIAFNPEGNILVTGDGSIKLWDISDSALSTSVKEICTLSGYTGGVSGIAFSPDDKILASANSDKSIKLWQIPSGKLLATLNGHTGAIRTINYSPDGKLLATTGFDQTLKLWHVSNNGGSEVFRTIISSVYVVNGIAFSPDGKYLVTGDQNGSIKLWEVRD
jgi:WD40 repeat protein